MAELLQQGIGILILILLWFSFFDLDEETEYEDEHPSHQREQHEMVRGLDALFQTVDWHRANISKEWAQRNYCLAV